MGGLTVLYAATVADKLDAETKGKMPRIDGAFAMCPLLDGKPHDHQNRNAVTESCVLARLSSG